MALDVAEFEIENSFMEFIMIKKDGYGLGKYALIPVFIALAVLLLAGCQAGNASGKNGQATGDGSITKVTAERFSGKNDKVRVYIETEEKMQVTITLDDGTSKTRNCNNHCQHVFNKVGDDRGTITVTNGRDSVEIVYEANP